MLTRPGSMAGPTWMRKFADGTVDPRQLRKMLARMVLLFAILQAGVTLVADIAVFQARGHHLKQYNSQAKIGDLPLLSVGGRARGVIAYGGVATGLIAIGGLATGVIAFGGLSMGLVAFGGVSVGVLALAGLALGWRAIGAVAIGNTALGALALGRYAYAGDGVAFGYHQASGKQKESLFG